MPEVVRLTVSVNDVVHQAIKRSARKTGQTQSALIRSVIVSSLRDEIHAIAERKATALISHRGMTRK